MFRALTSPRMLGLHLVAILATAAALLLGVWQYHAWQVNREHQALDLVTAAPKPLDTVISGDAPFPGDAVGQPVRFSGRWLPDDTIFVADRPLRGKTGYWVVTPVAVCEPAAPSECGTGSAILVVTGWTPEPHDAPAPLRGRVDVSGWLQPAEGSGIADTNPKDDVLPELRIADAIQHVDQDLYGGYVIAKEVSTGSTGGGVLEAVTPASLPQPDTFTSLRNLLYALEWWVFGGFALFLWRRWCSDEVKRVGDQAAGATTAPEPAQDAEVASSP